MSARLRAALGTAAVLALLGGCRTVPPPAVPVAGPGADAPWSEQYAALANLQNYALSGRVAVAANGQGFSANLRYRQQQQRADLSLDGPMGIGGMRMEFDERELKVTNSRGEMLDGAAARAEIEGRLGFELPLAQLRWWLLGLPVPGMPADKHQDAAGGAITDFQQDGWRVSINSRAPALGFSLPERLTAERDGARMKLLVENWQ